METFEELAEERRRLDDICRLHAPSLGAFKFLADARGFALHVEDVDTPPGDGETLPKQLTSTVTCIESLLSCRGDARESIGDSSTLGETSDGLRGVVRAVADAATARDFDSWQSDGSAEIYSRCRALPFVIQYLRGWRQLPKIEKHIGVVLYQMKQIPHRFAIGEAFIPSRGPAETNPYPPNAFHTYCTLELLRTLEECFPSRYGSVAKRWGLAAKRELMKLWARQQLGIQIALHAANSSTLDSDQLGWAIVIEARFSEGLDTRLADQDLIREALQCLFNTQLPVGTWRHYQPLFHYKRVGNAYCYVFETFAHLLGAALPNNRGALRNLLRPHFGGLQRLARYADATRRALPRRGVGWSSGHRASDPRPESWATASVFTFLENFRRLTGLWTRDAALRRFRLVSVPATANRDKAVRRLLERGDTWRSDFEPSVGEELESAFVNRVRENTREAELTAEAIVDRDEPVIAEDQARSAILFGPPGTGKTTLARSMAEAVGWEFIELHASDFVADGLTNVQRTADAIFRALSELDRCVVLFDEIDELVRSREDGQSDAFGRFLTTSMLPKLAEIWDRRKILYFVATNHVEFFDAAIKRSGRFDLLLFVPPTSFRSKLERLKLLLRSASKKNWRVELQQEQVDRALADVTTQGEGDPVTPGLAAFLAARWDELDELAEHTREVHGRATKITSSLITKALKRMLDDRFTKRATYTIFAQKGFARRDFRMRSAWPKDAAGSAKWVFSITGRRPAVAGFQFDDVKRRFVPRSKARKRSR